MNVAIHVEDRWDSFYFETIERRAEVTMQQKHPGYPCTKPGPRKYTVMAGSKHVDDQVPDFEAGDLTSLAAPREVMRALGVAYEEDLYAGIQSLISKLSMTRWSSEIPPELLGKPGNGYWWGMGPPWGDEHPRTLLYGEEG